jgi:hypothetical protein
MSDFVIDSLLKTPYTLAAPEGAGGKWSVKIWLLAIRSWLLAKTNPKPNDLRPSTVLLLPYRIGV